MLNESVGLIRPTTVLVSWIWDTTRAKATPCLPPLTMEAEIVEGAFACTTRAPYAPDVPALLAPEQVTVVVPRPVRPPPQYGN